MKEDIDINTLWSILDSQTVIKSDTSPLLQNYCEECDGKVIDNICRECGLMLNNNIEYSNYSFEEPIPTSKIYTSNSKIQKMQEWLRWSNDEKNEYKLHKYIRNLCETLDICEKLIIDICELVSQVMKALKNGHDGTKRSRVKDGIIIICIYYISKNNKYNYSYIELSKKIELHMKYVSKADKLIMGLINTKKLNVSKEFVDNILKTETPNDYIINIIEKYQIIIDTQYLNQTNSLINICEDNDILLDHTPLSIGVSCFYYILVINNIEINTKIFSDIYDLSMVTIIKTFNKLKKYKTNFEKLGIKKVIN